MTDTISGTLGEDGRGNAVGKDIQQSSITLNVGDKSPREIEELIARLPRITNIVLGDGLRWDGVVSEIRRLEEQIKKLSEHMVAMQQRMGDLESKIGRPSESDGSNVILTRLLIVAGILAVLVQAWQILFN